MTDGSYQISYQEGDKQITEFVPEEEFEFMYGLAGQIGKTGKLPNVTENEDGSYTVELENGAISNFTKEQAEFMFDRFDLDGSLRSAGDAEELVMEQGKMNLKEVSEGNKPDYDYGPRTRKEGEFVYTKDGWFQVGKIRDGWFGTKNVDYSTDPPPPGTLFWKQNDDDPNNGWYYIRGDEAYGGKIKDTYTGEDSGQVAAKPLVAKDQLIASGWKGEINDANLKDLNRILEKYEINTPERKKHFFAQVLHETTRGTAPFESDGGDSNYFKRMGYDEKYRGAGAIHLTHKEAYQAFAIYLALEKYGDKLSNVTFKSPTSNDEFIIDAEYKNLLAEAERLKLDITEFTDIIDLGYKYLCEKYFWESAGYYWATGTQKNLNNLIDSGASVDDITGQINSGDSAEGYKNRRDIFNSINNGVFN
ncbi:hypothetical protein LJC10_05325 [Selenomonadales bacterium OttesenSCG-928-I06]|nr:hypothetical protein [Selenomonadales bacterium OttesenSCG-928-I06]